MILNVQYQVKLVGINFLLLFFLLAAGFSCAGQNDPVRRELLLDDSWQTVENDTDEMAFSGFEQPLYNDSLWQTVDVPHNWDDYGGYRRMRDGNRHGTAWYRKKFRIGKQQSEQRYFLWFEGVGSYATVWLNGDSIGYHAGGRTSFTLDVTTFIHDNVDNVLAVRTDHPANIRNLPWVCGGCSSEWGFSEGSQPMGIFRSVHLIITNSLRVQPFGVHIWNNDQISEKSANLSLTTEVKNYGFQKKEIRVVNELKDRKGKTVKEVESRLTIVPEQLDTISQEFLNIENPHLWSLDDPYLYTVETSIFENDKLVDQNKIKYGIRWIKWDILGKNSTNRFYLNGNPVFINGVGEYEHLLGGSHAFSHEQIDARIGQVRAAGFNAFRDAHQPHNLYYKEKLDSLGLLWWPQMAAHIWFDTPEFRENFKQLLTDWIRERRNSPSVILWGLENESSLPTDFAQECMALIRKLDPTASSQRLVTTCNGGSGADWNVVQNWSGTYGGNPDNYGKELSTQLLNGEYGAWRSIDFHTEGGFVQDGLLSENRFDLLMEKKVCLAESVRDRVCGQFFWVLASHDNPGRTQSGEGLRGLDQIGPVNYKGAFTIWGEPLDVFYMFRANYAPKETEPMVYIVSHTWPERWMEPGIKSGISVFSNCDEVELFNGVRAHSLGRKTNGGKGTHFTWDKVDIENNVLYAVGYVAGKEVAHDQIVLNNLPKTENLEKLAGKVEPLTEDNTWNYIYRVNCGGPDYRDLAGNTWMADVHNSGENTWGSHSWTDDYPGLPAFYGSQRQTHDPIRGTLDWPLIQKFRYGRNKLSFKFPVPDGNYRIELYFTEPWYGIGGGLDCKGWRLFDVAVNDEVKIHKLDIWKEVGQDRLLKKTLNVTVSGGILKISFPKVEAGQAVISAIAISTKDPKIKAAPSSVKLITDLNKKNSWSAQTWMDTGDKCFSDADEHFVSLPPELYGNEWIRTPQIVEFPTEKKPMKFKLTASADVYIGIPDSVMKITSFSNSHQKIRTSKNGGKTYWLFQKRFAKNDWVELPFLKLDSPGSVILAAVPVSKMDDAIDLRPTVTLQSNDANGTENTLMTHFSGKECLKISGIGDAIEWKFSVGLASKYGLEFRYLNPGSVALQMEMSICGLDGTVMWKGPVTLEPSGEKWKSLRTDSHTTINAGTYKLKLSMLNVGSVYFNYLKIQ